MMKSNEILEREFLAIRAKTLEIAAFFDRLERAEGDVAHGDKLELIREALDIACSENSDRAEQVQLIFSRQYDDDWQEQFDLSPRA